MPQDHRTLSPAAMTAMSDALFAPCGKDLFGLELEWPTHRHGDVRARPRIEELGALDGTVLAAGGRVTFEPGGQVELSTAPFASVTEALQAARSDRRTLFAHMAAAGYTCQTLAVDDRRTPHRVLSKPRYSAMDAFFSRQGDTGVWMMTNTTATQINVSHDPLDPSLRWDLLHRISPVLIAAFANSPGTDLRGQRWACLRQAIWWSIDPARTRPVPADLPPASAWLEYALGADVMFICGEDGLGTALDPGLSFGRWMSEGHALGWPTIADLRHHLSTLFPPVRPRGWLELRVLDALPEWICEVAALTVATACTRPAARDLLERLPDTSELWPVAMQHGLADPRLAAAADTLFEVVARDLAAVTQDPVHAEQLAGFRAGYVDLRRCPGDTLSSEYDLRRPCLVSAVS